jgi:type IV pilus assembly protein PilA
MTEDRPTTPPPPPPTPSPYPAQGQPKPSRPAWFWIAIIGGGVLLISPLVLILLALAIPQMLAVKKQANETSAIQTVRTIASAQVSYNVTYPANGYACSLAALGGDPASGVPTAQAAQLIDPTLASTGQKSGYTFAITCGNKLTANNQDTYTSYQLTAIPQTVGKTGTRGFCSTETGELKYDPDGGPNCNQPVP